MKELVEHMATLQKDAMKELVTALNKPKSTVSINPQFKWPILEDSDTEVEDVFEAFRDYCGLAADGAGMPPREMLKLLLTCLKGNRLKTAKHVVKQHKKTTVLTDPKEVINLIEAKLLRFKESLVQKQTRISQEFDEMQKGTRTGLEWEPYWEDLLNEMKLVGLTRTEVG